MAVELKVPPAGESITEVQIGEWLKKVGDSVRRDEIIVVIETDKVTVELPAPVDGVLTSIAINDGQDASVGDVIGTMEEGAVAESSPSAATSDSAPKAPADSAPADSAPEPSSPPVASSPQKASSADSSVRDSLPPEAFARVMPAARRVAEESGV